MIQSEAQLSQAREAMTRLESALQALRLRIAPKNTALFEAMAQDYVAGIRTLRAEIDAYTGLSLADEQQAPLWMVLDGSGKLKGDISSRLLAEWLDRLRKAVFGVTSYLETGTIRRGGRPDRALVEATDFRVLLLKPGSIKVGLRLPPAESQGDLFQDEQVPAARRAIDHLLRMTAWAASGSDALPTDEFPDNDTASVVAAELLELVPSARSIVKTVAFSGAIVPSTAPLVLVQPAQDKLEGLVSLLAKTTEDRVRGTMREIDLDRQRFILRERGEGMGDLRCIVPEELMRRAEELLGRQVEVEGTVSSARPSTLNVTRLDSI